MNMVPRGSWSGGSSCYLLLKNAAGLTFDVSSTDLTVVTFNQTFMFWSHACTQLGNKLRLLTFSRNWGTVRCAMDPRGLTGRADSSCTAKFRGRETGHAHNGIRVFEGASSPARKRSKSSVPSSPPAATAGRVQCALDNGYV